MTKLQMIVLTSVLASPEGINPAALISLIEASGNVEVALEMLAGVYKQPEISETPTKLKFNGETNIRFLSFDPYKEKITYQYNRRNSAHCWVENTCEVEPLLENISRPMRDYEAVHAAAAVGMIESDFVRAYTRKIVFGTPEVTTTTSTCNLTSW